MQPAIGLRTRGTIRLHRDGNGRPYTVLHGWEWEGPTTIDDREQAAFMVEFVSLMCRERATETWINGQPTLVFGGRS